MESVSIETTVLSDLVALPAQNPVVAWHQPTTYDWWHRRRVSFHCVISQVVIDEISAGDPTEIKKRLLIAETLSVLSLTNESERLTESIMRTGVLPSKAIQDAEHIAVAAVHGIEYLLTWNCKHLANAQISRRIAILCANNGFQMPTICTPEELLEEPVDAE